MGFLLLSAEYPSETHRAKFFRKSGPHSNFSSPFHKPLAAAATDDQWRRVLKAIRDNVKDSSFLHDQLTPRPLKPNDDNYEAFTGRKWKPKTSTQTMEAKGTSPSVAQALSALRGQDDNDTPYPHYDRCAKCTKLFPNMNQCSRCKIVKYCSRECQSSHWRKVHKESCTKAQILPLYKIMNGNDGFLISPEECRALQLVLSNNEIIDSDEVIRCFQAYFSMTEDLGGCFVL